MKQKSLAFEKKKKRQGVSEYAIPYDGLSHTIKAIKIVSKEPNSSHSILDLI